MSTTPNVSQLTAGAPTAGELQPGKLANSQTVVGGTPVIQRSTVQAGALYTPTHILSGVESVNGMTGVVELDASDVGAASQNDFEAHVNNTTIHVTGAEKAAWNQCLIGAVNAEESLTFWHAADVI